MGWCRLATPAAGKPVLRIQDYLFYYFIFPVKLNFKNKTKIYAKHDIITKRVKSVLPVKEAVGLQGNLTDF